MILEGMKWIQAGTSSPSLTCTTMNDKPIALEPRPTEEFKRADPEDYEELSQRPSFLCIRALKSEITGWIPSVPPR